jgi:hypothetical protein
VREICTLGLTRRGLEPSLRFGFVTHSQRKRRATARPNLRLMARVLDPTSSHALLPFPSDGILGLARVGCPAGRAPESLDFARRSLAGAVICLGMDARQCRGAACVRFMIGPGEA